MVLQLLLARKDEDPTARQNDAIISASAHMRHEVVKLLSHPSVKPSQSENKALVAAAGAGKKKVVKLLLDDPRVQCTGRALAIASTNRHSNITQILTATNKHI
jgi:hypothetical protein